jgi:hypothetical protein
VQFFRKIIGADYIFMPAIEWLDIYLTGILDVDQDMAYLESVRKLVVRV